MTVRFNITLGVVACLLILFTPLCVASDQPPVSKVPAPTLPDSPSEERVALNSQIVSIGEEVAMLRGLELLKVVTVSVKTPSAFTQDVLQSIADDAEENRVDYTAQSQIYKLLGIVRPEDDYQSLLERLYGTGVAGYYDSDSEEIVVPAMPGTSMLAPQDLETLRHEYVHALQDQHFDLDALFESAKHSGDALQALGALIEGDAESIIYPGLEGSPQNWLDLSTTEPSVFDFDFGDWRAQSPAGVPPMITILLSFSYQDGLIFAARLGSLGGYRRITDALRSPPTSTEQILHPETKYLGPFLEAPLAVAPRNTYPTWSVWTTDTLGELWLKVWLSQLNGDWVAETVTAGWGGDVIEVLNRDNGSSQDWALRIAIAWDEPLRDGREFGLALETALRTAPEFSTTVCPTLDSAWQGPLGVLTYHTTADSLTEIIVAPKCSDLSKIKDGG